MQQMGQSGESLPKHSVASSQNAKADKTIKTENSVPFTVPQLTSSVPIVVLLKDQN